MYNTLYEFRMIEIVSIIIIYYIEIKIYNMY